MKCLKAWEGGDLKLLADEQGRGREEGRKMGRHSILSVLYSQDCFVGKKFGRLLYNHCLGILVKCPCTLQDFRVDVYEGIQKLSYSVRIA